MKKTLFFVSTLVLTCFANATYIGGSLGYLTDSEALYESGRIGYTFVQLSNTSHSLEVEVGHSYKEKNGVSVRVVPTVINYRGETSIGQNAFIYYGLGVGSAYVKAEFNNHSASDSSFVFQSFGGAGYRMSEKASLLAGVRYLRVADFDTVGSENDFGFNLGLQISF